MPLKIVVELPPDRRFAGALRLDGDGGTLAGPFPVLGKADQRDAESHGNRERESTRLYGDTPLGTYRCAGFLQSRDDEDARRHGPFRIRITPAGGEAQTAADHGRTQLQIHGGTLADDGGYRPTNGCLRLSDDDLESLIEAIQSSGALPGVCEVLPTAVELVDLAAPDTGGGEGDPPPLPAPPRDRPAPSDPKRRFLLELGTADVAHSSDDLLDHLEGTHDLLRAWGGREALCDAGLFHSVYGTESFQHPALTVALRDRVRELIGEEAETIVYLNHVKENGPFLHAALALRGDEGGEVPPLQSRFTGEAIACSRQTFLDLIDLTLANALEQVPRVPQYYGAAEQELYGSLLDLALPGARTDFNRLFGRAE